MSRPPYQDKWRDGALIEKGRRECADRFEAISGHVGPVGSVIDVGGWDGYFSRRFAEAGAHCVLVEPRNVVDLPVGVEHRQERVSATSELPSVEVGLALSVLHHMDDWEQVYAHLRAACEVLVVETPHPEELDGELSPTLVETGGRIGPIYERVLRDGTTITETPGPNGLARPIVAVTNTIVGVVEDGLGRASEVMAERPAEFWSPLGYQPVPGTLNLRVGRAGKSWVRRLQAPVTLDADAGGVAGPYWPVSIDGVEAHVRTSRAQATVEIVSPVRLRSVGLDNGDPVTVRPR